MRKLYKTLLYGGLFAVTLGLSSCEDYLATDPVSTLLEGDVSKDFMNFQGVAAELYN